MKAYYISILLFFVALFSSTAQEVKKENPFTTKWDNGLKIENTDKTIKIKFGGRLMYDNGFFSLNNEAETNGYSLISKNGNEFRRARFTTSGMVYKNIDFKLQIDFSGGEVTLKDAFITLKKLPVVGNFKVGHFKEPFRLETLTSSNYITFMERALSNNISPERNSGMMLYNEILDKRMAWQIGVFRNANKSTSDNPTANGDYAITSRIAGTAMKSEKTLLHLGLSHSYRKPQEDKKFGFSVRPEVHISDKYITTNVDDVENVNLVNLETAFLLNSFSIQGEYTIAKIKSTIENQNFNSFYAQVSCFLTGEKRPYKNSLSGFGRVEPNKNFGDNGKGAIELALRYSSIDGMNDDTMNNFTAGINWYLNPATRIMTNYVVSNINNNTQYSGKGTFSAFQMRFQINF